MEVFSFLGGGFSSNTYLCRDPASGACVLIDPGADEAGVLSFLGERRPEKILLTHGHFDHITAAAAVRERTGAPVLAHESEAQLLRDPAKNASFPLGRKQVSLTTDTPLTDGDQIRFGGCVLRVVHTPGHSPGGICLYGEGCLFCGDTLFEEGVGRTDLFGGSEAALMCSLECLKMLPAATRVFPGHGEEFLLGSRFAQNERS